MTTEHEVEFVTWKAHDVLDGGRTGRWMFYLAGERGTVQFVYLRFTLNGEERVLPNDLGYHSPQPRYEGQSRISEPGECHALRGPLRAGPCYYDGSGLAAQSVYAAYEREGDVAVWRELREYYTRTFYDGNAYGFGRLMKNVSDILSQVQAETTSGRTQAETP